MGKRNKNMKLEAKILSLAMITTMMSGYVAPPKEVKADTFNSSHSYEVNTQATEVVVSCGFVVVSAGLVVELSVVVLSVVDFSVVVSVDCSVEVSIAFPKESEDVSPIQTARLDGLSHTTIH